MGWLLNLFGGGILKTITGSLTQAHQSRLNAKNTTERIEADGNIATLNAQKAILLAEQNSKLTSWIRPAFAAPFVLYLWKIVVYDKMLGLGSTPDLSTEQHYIMGTIIGAYFLTRPFEKFRSRK